MSIIKTVTSLPHYQTNNYKYLAFSCSCYYLSEIMLGKYFRNFSANQTDTSDYFT